MYRIPLSYTPVDGRGLSEVLARYEGQDHQAIIADFEQALASITGARYVVALNSGTAAIHLALKALQVAQGDYVVTSNFTYVATANPILYEGAIPFFIDSERQTWNMDPSLLEDSLKKMAARGQRAKALLLVHTYGAPAHVREIEDIAKKFGLPIIEDAAEALGSSYEGRQLGTFGDLGVLSFNNNKTLTTYGGGAVLTDNADYYTRMLRWATQSREDLPYYQHAEVGYNYRMGPLNAAMGVCELATLNAKIADRREVRQRYQADLAGLVEFQQEFATSEPNHWLSAILIDPSRHAKRIAELQDQLGRAGIESRRLWNPMHQQPVFKGRHQAAVNGVSDDLFARGIALPSARLTATQQAEIISIIRSF